jgi:hypothetical protein
MSLALAPAHAEAIQAVRAAVVKNVDETSWRKAGKRCWLWAAATATVAAFVIHARRSAAGLTTLLGDLITGIIVSDRWSVYQQVAVDRWQICWAHTIRTQSLGRFPRLVYHGSRSIAGAFRPLEPSCCC